MKPGSPLASFLTGVAMFLLLWLLAAALINRPILPSPLIVLPLFGRLILAELGLHFVASAGRVLAAILLAVATAVPAGLALGQMPALNRLFAPPDRDCLPDPQDRPAPGDLRPDGDYRPEQNLPHRPDHLFSDHGGRPRRGGRIAP